MSAVLLGPRAAIASLVVNALTLIVVGFLITMGLTSWYYPVINPVWKWIVIFFNFMLFNTVTTISLTLILNGLYRTLEEERKMAEYLRQK